MSGPAIKNIMLLIGLFIPALFFSSCYERVNHKGKFDYEAVQGSFHYDLSDPDDHFRLPEDLEEISGLTWVDEGTLGAIQDEIGHMYYINLKSGEVTTEIRFGAEGDYEGVENVEDIVFAVKSNGKLYRFPISDEDVEGQLFDNPLNVQNNVEALAYWPERNMLLLGCKDDQELNMEDLEEMREDSDEKEEISNIRSGTGKESDEYKDDLLIYGFEVGTMTFISTPLIAIDEDDIEKKFEADYKGKFDGDKFAVSAMAYHPIEKSLYLISSAARLLIVANMDGSVKSVIPIDREVLRQPEGMCIGPDGSLFIASEGRGGDGYLVRFRYRKN